MLKKNYIKEKLSNKKPVIGTWSIIPSTIVVDILSNSGLDFIILDREHGPLTFETAQEMIIACESNSVSPIIRVGDIIKADIQNALDIGSHGIQIPNVENTDDVKKIIKFSKFPPNGDRGFSPFTRAGGYSIENAKNLMNKANNNTLNIINIESIKAFENIENFCKFKEVDIFFIGLFDLSKSLNIPGQIEDKQIINIVKEIVKIADKYNKHVGTISNSIEKINYYKDIGLRYLVHLVDCEMLRDSYSKIVKSINK